jgi:hypothetical protein
MLVLGMVVAMLLLAPLTSAQDEAPDATPASSAAEVATPAAEAAEAASEGEQAAGVSTLVLLLGIGVVFLIGIGAVLRDTARSRQAS